jgi:mono/diheme cytochrome c family protein
MAHFGKRNPFLFWIVAAVLATAVLAATLVYGYHASATRRSAYIVGVPDRGAELFFGSKKCATCHSINGAGGHVGPDLSGKRPETPAMGWMTTVLWNHAPGMWRQMRRGNGPYPRLTQEEMADMLVFLFQAGNTDPKGDAGAGRSVFEGKSCARCHSVRGAGGNSAPDLSRIAGPHGSTDWAAAMWNHAQSMVEPVTRALREWPEFKGAEMNDLMAYAGVSGPSPSSHAVAVRGRAEPGWRVFQAKCMQCHSVRGQGGAIGPELGPDKDLPLTTARFASVMWNHAPAMLKLAREKGVPAPTLQGDEMTHLLVFLGSLRFVEPTGSALLGERIFSERGCARCHGAKADGAAAPALRFGADAYTAVSFTAALWRHGPRMQDRAEELGIEWPILKPNDIGDLVSFLNAPDLRR